jgi:Ca-activated chloride channel homolog
LPPLFGILVEQSESVVQFDETADTGMAMFKKSLPIGLLLLSTLPAFSQKIHELKPGMTIRAEVSLVNVPFRAMDGKGRTIASLKAEDFQIFDNGRLQKVEYFSNPEKNAAVPLKIALVMDTSDSVRDKLDFEINTAAEFLNQILRPNMDSAAIIQFDSDVNLVQDFTQNLDALLHALTTLQPGGNTALFDAIYLAAEEKLKNETGRRVIIVISDGADNVSSVRMMEAIASVQRRDVLVYGIGVLCSQCYPADLDALKRFTKETGGMFFSPKAQLSAIREAFRVIGLDIQGQYSLAYTPENIVHDGSFRSLDLRCRVPGVRIRTRKGYYAPSAATSN